MGESRMTNMSRRWEKMAFGPMMRFPKMGKLPKGGSMSVITGGSDRIVKMKDGKPTSTGKSFMSHKRVVRKNGMTLCQVRSKRSTTKNGKVLNKKGGMKWRPCKSVKKAKSADKKPKAADKKKKTDGKKEKKTADKKKPADKKKTAEKKKPAEKKTAEPKKADKKTADKKETAEKSKKAADPKKATTESKKETAE